MKDLILSNQVQNQLAHERDRILGGVVKLVGALSESVIGEIGGDASIIEEKENIITVNNEAEDIETVVEKVVDKALSGKFEDILKDISYRLDVLDDMAKSVEGKPHKITSRHLNLAHHIIDGYAVTANSPSAGYISWTDVHVVYQGNDHTVSNSSTNNKFVWWLATTPSAFQVTNTKPTLGANDTLVFVNEAGTPINALSPGKMQSGAFLLDGTVGNGEISDGAVASAKIAANAIFSTHITPSAVTSTALAASAVTSGKIASGAVTSAAIGSGAITSAAIASNAVSATHIGSSQVTSTKLAASAVTSAALAASAVTAAALAASAVTSNAIADGSIIGSKVGSAAIAAEKLNLATHMLY